jgi:dienelactone hydrolase
MMIGISVGATLLAEGEPAWPVLKQTTGKNALPGTQLLEAGGDLSIAMVEGVDRFLDAEIAAELKERRGGTRQELARILGLPRDQNPKDNSFRYAGRRWGPVGNGRNYTVNEVSWKTFGNTEAVGLLFEPSGRAPLADIIALPDADQDPEELGAMEPYFESQQTHPFAAEMALAGCRVLVPVMIKRMEHHAMPMREWLHRPAWELGRTLAGYEVLKVLAAVDCFRRDDPSRSGKSTSGKLAVVGWGEGGRLALYAAALDERLDGTLVSGYFGPRSRVWDEPADRTVFGLLRGHSDAEIARLIAPRPLVIETGHFPEYGFRLDQQGLPERVRKGAGKRGKPGKLLEPRDEEVRLEAGLIGNETVVLRSTDSAIQPDSWRTLLEKIGVGVPANNLGKRDLGWAAIKPLQTAKNIARRHAEQVQAIDRHNQRVLVESEQVRGELFKVVKLDSLENYEASIAPLREKFSREVIGEHASLQNLAEPNAHTRSYQEGPDTISYEVVLDVQAGVQAYGILTLPKDMKLDGSEKRPVVVCQHGLEGRPQSTVGEKDYHYYKAFATRLAERGFVTFAPQNLYLGWDLFRILQFKANAVGCTLFSVMVPQHRQITEWLAGLPFVDAERIGFYGLSYGGKSAMRIPPLVDRYCLSICSADFNEWVWKNAATDPLALGYSYANKGEYEIFEFDLGGTFNYFEMAALICPRPFMVERGHFDGVAPDKTVAYEFAKVRFLYAARLGIGNRAEIEWFVGPHTINGKKTYDFLHRHLEWPGPTE